MRRPSLRVAVLMAAGGVACSTAYSSSTKDGGTDAATTIIDAGSSDGSSIVDGGAQEGDASCSLDLTTDTSNCGACGVVCGLGATCIKGACSCGPGGQTCGRSTPPGCDGGVCVGEVVGECHGYVCKKRTTLAATTNAQQLALDSEAAYVAQLPLPEGGAVAGAFRVPLDGSGVTPLGMTGGARGIAVDSSNVTWAATNEGQIYQCPRAGCTSAIKYADDTLPISVASAGNTVAFLDFGGTLHVCQNAACVQTLISGVGRFAANPNAFYFTAAGPGNISELSFAGAIKLLVGGENQPFAIAADATAVFWVSLDAIKSLPLGADGGVPTTIRTGTFGTANSHSTAIAIDTTAVYWTDPTGVLQCPRAGCPAAPATATITPAAGWALAVDGTHVYFAGADAIYSIEK